MAFDLRNKEGATIRVSGGHWAVFLTLAQTYGWKPAGTNPPPGFSALQKWNRRYDSSDGQVVTDADAKLLAQVLHAAAVSAQVNIALSDVIRHVESQVEAIGTPIREEWRMKPEHFHAEFSPLLLFL